MAAELKLKLIAELTGLGEEFTMAKNTTQTTVPTRSIYQYMIQATTNTEEALILGDVSTEQTLIIFATDNVLDIDLDWVTAFDADFTIPEGEFAVIPRPAGTIYFKNNIADEVCTFEYLLVGT